MLSISEINQANVIDAFNSTSKYLGYLLNIEYILTILLNNGLSRGSFLNSVQIKTINRKYQTRLIHDSF